MPDGSRPRAAGSDAVLTIPNVISLARLCAVPVTVWLVVRHQLRPAFWMFLAAGLSDAADGWLARRGAGSALGAVLDPLADKALLTSMYVVLAAVALLPDWLAILVVFRDLVIVGGVLLMTTMGLTVVIDPLRISKLNTALQILLVAAVLSLAAFAWARPAALQWLIGLVALTTLASGAAYVGQAAKG